MHRRNSALAPRNVANSSRGVKNADFDSFAIAIQLIEAQKYPFEKMHTHSFALRDLERTIQTLAGRVAGEQAVSVSLNPWL